MGGNRLKPAPFDYVRPSSIAEALAFLDGHPDAAVIAGGQSLAPMLNMRLIAPSHLVDIGALPGLRDISVADGWLRMGALLRHRDLASAPEVASRAPLFRDAVLHIGHPAIRNRGTLGGSLAMADPAAELPACLLALGGRVEVAGRDGSRHIAANDFFTGAFETALRPGELLCAVEVPVAAPGSRSAIDELARRHGDYALAGLAAHGRIDDGRVSDLRLAFFAVGDKPVLAAAAAARLEGEVLSAANIAAAVAAIADDVEPSGQPDCSAGTKLHYCTVLAKRLLGRMAA